VRLLADLLTWSKRGLRWPRANGECHHWADGSVVTASRGVDSDCRCSGRGAMFRLAVACEGLDDVMRPPQQRHGRGSTRGSSAAVVADVDARESRPVGTPSTLTKAPAGRQSAPLSGFPRGSTSGRLAPRRRCQRISRAAQRRHLRRGRNSRRVIRSLIRSAENSASCRKRICPHHSSAFRLHTAGSR
jgi:hypothetical protein